MPYLDFCRINLSIAIVKMAGKNENNSTVNQSNICAVTGNSTDNGGNDEEFEPDYDWSQAARGDLLGSYYYGYVCTQIVGAWLSSKFGFKILLFTNTLVASVLTIVIL